MLQLVKWSYKEFFRMLTYFYHIKHSLFIKMPAIKYWGGRPQILSWWWKVEILPYINILSVHKKNMVMWHSHIQCLHRDSFFKYILLIHIGSCWRFLGYFGIYVWNNFIYPPEGSNPQSQLCVEYYGHILDVVHPS